MLKVGIPVLFSEQHWMGGINYFRSLISAFSLVEQNDIELIIFVKKMDCSIQPNLIMFDR
ncbi:hypothetical protein [Escherichia coli]|uniref:hypothetical protein n=1 Tax=Escherichia coli TaxID=562 RepID=UPI00388E50AA